MSKALPSRASFYSIPCAVRFRLCLYEHLEVHPFLWGASGNLDGGCSFKFIGPKGASARKPLKSFLVLPLDFCLGRPWVGDEIYGQPRTWILWVGPSVTCRCFLDVQEHFAGGILQKHAKYGCFRLPNMELEQAQVSNWRCQHKGASLQQRNSSITIERKQSPL